jgi:hypothetical protein
MGKRINLDRAKILRPRKPVAHWFFDDGSAWAWKVIADAR